MTPKNKLNFRNLDYTLRHVNECEDTKKLWKYQMFSVQNSVVHARRVLRDFEVKHKMTEAEGECLCTLSKSPATSQEHG